VSEFQYKRPNWKKRMRAHIGFAYWRFRAELKYQWCVLKRGLK
jgi:hypothetical protein